MKINALEGVAPQPSLLPLTEWEPSGMRGDLAIRGKQYPHHTSSAARASSASLGWPWLPALGSWGNVGTGVL